jgi:hypothetical protein
MSKDMAKNSPGPRDGAAILPVAAADMAAAAIARCP